MNGDRGNAPAENAGGERIAPGSPEDGFLDAMEMFHEGRSDGLGLLKQAAEEGCDEARLFLGILHYRSEGISAGESQRWLNDSGRTGYTMWEFLRQYPADIDDYVLGKKGFDDGLLSRVREWFSASEDEKEYYRRRSLRRVESDMNGGNGIFFSTPVKTADYFAWRREGGDVTADTALALKDFENGNYTECLERCISSGLGSGESLFLAGRCCAEGLDRPEEALVYFLRSSEKGSAEAAYRAFLLARKGHGNLGEAQTSALLGKAVLGNVRGATNDLFSIYLTDENKRPRTLELFERAFKNGNYDARAYEGFIEFFGFGKGPDMVKAQRCFEDAYGRCQYATYVGFLLGHMYVNGLGDGTFEKRGNVLIGRYRAPGATDQETLENIRTALLSRALKRKRLTLPTHSP